MYQNRHQRRIADVIRITPSAVKQIPYPEEDVLQDLYEKYKSNFYTPEYRTIKYAQVESKDLEGDATLTIEEVLSKYNIDSRVNIIGPIDNNERDQNGNKFDNLPKTDAFIRAVFSINDDKTHFVSFSTDHDFQVSHFLVTVIDITAPRLKDFQESKSSLIELWHNEFTNRQMYEIASDLESELQAEADISNIEGIEFSKEQVFSRFEIIDAERLTQPKDLIDEVFTIKEGSLTKPIKDQNDVLIGMLKEVQNANEEADEVTIKTMKDELVRGSVDALKKQLIRHLYDKYKVKIDNSKMS
ncbi:hypothetical protein [Candidatus Mesenet endosymbiont of Phosphuga atrata]|uniref:hypothetical protein n=1 Tax=Candidatus Mesenet endosymbiont of Phosphuga atrata TaxID=3066221 RepID=UPI0030D50141